MKQNNPFVLAGYEDMLVEKELVYPSPDGYVICDRLMAEYLRSLG